MRVFLRVPASPRERAARGNGLDRDQPNALGDARGFALEHGARGFGRDVARGQAGAAGGQHQVGRARGRTTR